MPTLDFKGKQFVYAHHLSVPFKQLDIDRAKSLPKDGKPSLDDNLIIQGDNLHALKALLPQYAGKIKCIYIDPPYNTGNEGWCYSDNVNAPTMKEWLKKEGNPVDKEDLERHDKWLCMIWPRLTLLCELLSEKGLIFISIDDNELHNLISVLSELLGEQNLIAACPVISNLKGNQDQFGFAGTHEYLVVFAKNKSLCAIKEYPLTDEDLQNWQEDDIGLYKKGAPLRATGEDALREKRPYMFYPILIKNSKVTTISSEEHKEIYNSENNSFNDNYLESLIKKYEEQAYTVVLPKDEYGNFGRWRWGYSEENSHRISYDVLFFKGKKGYSLYKKQRPELGELPSNKQKSLFYKPEYSTTTAKNETKNIFQKNINFTTKSSFFVKDIIKIAAKTDAIILDSFAGSGTTAHAVLALNKEDGGNRKFILVEMEEYANDTTAERVRRVIKGVPTAKDIALKEGLGGSFTFCELGQEINIENLLKGEKLPSYDELARYAFYTATGLTLDKVEQGADYYIGETENYRVHLVYKPDIAFLRSGDSALNMPLAQSISKAREDTGKSALVFATHKFMGQKELTEMGITYCQLPYAIHRVMGD